MHREDITQGRVRWKGVGLPDQVSRFQHDMKSGFRSPFNPGTPYNVGLPSLSV